MWFFGLTCGIWWTPVSRWDQCCHSQIKGREVSRIDGINNTSVALLCAWKYPESIELTARVVILGIFRVGWWNSWDGWLQSICPPSWISNLCLISVRIKWITPFWSYRLSSGSHPLSGFNVNSTPRYLPHQHCPHLPMEITSDLLSTWSSPPVDDLLLLHFRNKSSYIWLHPFLPLVPSPEDNCYSMFCYFFHNAKSSLGWNSLNPAKKGRNYLSSIN